MKILKALNAPLRVEDLELQIQASIGVAQYPGDGQAQETLLSRADQAMYAAKDARGDNFRVIPLHSSTGFGVCRQRPVAPGTGRLILS